jgi:hypothetical protein
MGDYSPASGDTSGSGTALQVIGGILIVISFVITFGTGWEAEWLILDLLLFVSGLALLAKGSSMKKAAAVPPAPGIPQPLPPQAYPQAPPRRATVGSVNFCPSCGARVRPNARFCGSCGEEL